MTESFWDEAKDKVCEYLYTALIDNIIIRGAGYGAYFIANHNDYEACYQFAYGVIIPVELGLSYLSVKHKKDKKEIEKLEEEIKEDEIDERKEECYPMSTMQFGFK